MTSRTRKGLAAVCLLLQLTGAALAFGRVLCVASDGHVVVEVAHAGSCETETRRHHDRDEPGALRGCGDHPCTDVALSHPAWHGRSRALDDATAPYATVVPHAIEATAVATVVTTPSPGPHDPVALRARRTVVLLV
jgi:hypothetical protein